MVDKTVWDNFYGDRIDIGTLSGDIRIFEGGGLIGVYDGAGSYILAQALRELDALICAPNDNSQEQPQDP